MDNSFLITEYIYVQVDNELCFFIWPVYSSLDSFSFAVSIPDNGGNLLLSEEFLRNCMEMFSAPSRVIGNTRVFKQKHLNIIDPLNETNNLGRSVHRGTMNFYDLLNLYKIFLLVGK